MFFIYPITRYPYYIKKTDFDQYIKKHAFDTKIQMLVISLINLLFQYFYLQMPTGESFFEIKKPSLLGLIFIGVIWFILASIILFTDPLDRHKLNVLSKSKGTFITIESSLDNKFLSRVVTGYFLFSMFLFFISLISL